MPRLRFADLLKLRLPPGLTLRLAIDWRGWSKVQIDRLDRDGGQPYAEITVHHDLGPSAGQLAEIVCAALNALPNDGAHEYVALPEANATNRLE